MQHKARADQQQGVERSQSKQWAIYRRYSQPREPQINVSGNKHRKQTHFRHDKPHHAQITVGVTAEVFVMHRNLVFRGSGPLKHTHQQQRGSAVNHQGVLGKSVGKPAKGEANAHHKQTQCGHKGPDRRFRQVNHTRIALELETHLVPVVQGALSREHGRKLDRKVFRGRRGTGSPLEGIAPPGIVPGFLATLEAPEHIVEPNGSAHRQHEGPNGGKQVQFGPHGIVGRVSVVTARHP